MSLDGFSDYQDIIETAMMNFENRREKRAGLAAQAAEKKEQAAIKEAEKKAEKRGRSRKKAAEKKEQVPNPN